MKIFVLAILILGSVCIKALDTSHSFRISHHQNNLVDGFRPPAVPLIVFDPFMSIWSMSDHLYDDFPKFWCGSIKALVGAIRIDGKPYRFMGPSPGVPTENVIPQKSVRVEPTQTYYTFQTSEITLNVIFSTMTIPTDLDLLSQPISYITFEVSSNDGKQHQVELYYDQTAEIAISNTSEQVTWNRYSATKEGPEYIMYVGTTTQKILGKSGDCDSINWGYSYLAVQPIDDNDDVQTVISGSVSTRTKFIQTGKIPTQDDMRKPRPANDDWPVLAVSWSFKVSPSQTQSRYVIFGYDDIASINYFGQLLPPYWRKNGQTIQDVLKTATKDYSKRMALLKKYDSDLLANLTAAASPEYATIASLSFRQTFGGCKLVWNEKTNTPWYFMKEISSDGDIQTVDVIFPASPLFFYTNPYLMELSLIPLLAYANNETSIQYNLSWAPHHLGIYPIANIRPQDQEQMPVEETGNLLMMIAALVSFSKSQVKDYQSLIFPKYDSLIKSDPGDQLCTDDFLGPSPHNVNLALKGIVGLECYARLCQLMGRTVDAAKYLGFAKIYEEYWMKNANDGDHSRLQYDLPNTWSLKYNLLYQNILGLKLFPDQVIQNEVSFYMKNHLNTYGIPLNSKVTFTKLDWLAWIAAMAPNNSDRIEIFKRIYKLAHETSSRVPLTDWYDTVSGKQKGFQARTVVGGVYAWMLLKPQSVWMVLA